MSTSGPTANSRGSSARGLVTMLTALATLALVTILPEIPKGPTGKVQRRNLAGLVAR